MAENGIIGNNSGIDLPLTQIDERLLDDERKMAKFSKTDEFKRLKEHLDERINFYQTFLPDGRPLNSDVKAENWVIANAIIGELKGIILAYEQANQVVKDAIR